MSSERSAVSHGTRGAAQRLRSWFFTGLVIFGPVALTLYVAWWAIDTVDGWVRTVTPAQWWPDTYLPVHVPGFGVVIAIVGVTLVGFLAANFAGRTLVAFGDAMLDRTPIVRSLYKSLKQIFETLFSHSSEQFRKVGLVEFPVKGTYSIVFISSEPPKDLADRIPVSRPMTSVFLPCSPNPTTGFYFFVPTDEIVELPYTPEEGVKLVMSAGLIQPVATQPVPDRLNGSKDRPVRAVS
jgi:uncharacterized membrane protein